MAKIEITLKENASGELNIDANASPDAGDSSDVTTVTAIIFSKITKYIDEMKKAETVAMN